MSLENGGPAFPIDDPNKFDPLSIDEYRRLASGMTLRDYFAAKALQGICAHHDTWGLLIQDIADRSYEIADAMLAERAK